jgi:hypothetical protein
MSIESIAIALHHSKAQGTAKLVLLGIANHDGDGGAWPSMGTLRKYAGGIDKRAVQRAVDRLEGLGEVRRIIQKGGDHSIADWERPNLYRFLLHCPSDCDRTSQHRTRRSVELALVPDFPQGVVETPPGGHSTTPGGGHSTTQTVLLTQPQEIKKETQVIAHARKEQSLCVAGHPLAVGTDYCLYGCLESAVAREKANA